MIHISGSMINEGLWNNLLNCAAGSIKRVRTRILDELKPMEDHCSEYRLTLAIHCNCKYDIFKMYSTTLRAEARFRKESNRKHKKDGLFNEHMSQHFVRSDIVVTRSLLQWMPYQLLQWCQKDPKTEMQDWIKDSSSNSIYTNAKYHTPIAK